MTVLTTTGILSVCALAAGAFVGWRTSFLASAGGPWGSAWFSLFGLVGLAARGAGGNEIERLTAEIERFEAGEEVDFSTDREDEVGDLYDAVERLAASARAGRQDGSGDAGAGTGGDGGDGSDGTEPSGEYLHDLERKASLLDAVFEQVPTNLYVKDREGRHVRTSSPYYNDDYDHLDEEWFNGKTDLEIYSEELSRDTHEDDLHVVETGESIRERVEYNPDVEEWVLTSKVPWRDENGEIQGLIGTSQYISDQIERQRELEETRDRLEEQTGTLRRLTEITADRETSFDEKVTRILALGRERLDTEAAYLSSIDVEDGTFEIEYADGNEDRVAAGDTAPLSETYCRETLDTDGLLAAADVPVDDQIDDDTHERWGHDCYIGGRVEVEGTLYGTLCFVDEAACEAPFTDQERTFVELATRWMSYELERRERERELREYREFTDDVLDAIDDVFYLLDDDGDLRRWNHSLAEVTGYADEAIAEMNAVDFFDDEDAERIATALDDIDNRTGVPLEVTLRTKEGTAIPYELVAAPLEDLDGERVVAGIGRDISERRDRERKLAAIVRNTSDPIYIKDRDGVYQFVNEATGELVGVDPTEVVGQTDADLFGPADIDDVREGDRQVLETGDPVTKETRITVDGIERVFLDDKFPYRDDDGQIVGVMGISRDITERTERQRELRETKRRLEIALEGTNTGIWEWDPETDEVTWSETLERLIGLDPGEFEGTYEAFLERLHPEDRPAVVDAADTAVANDDFYQMEYRMRHENGEWRWFESRGQVVSEDGHMRVIGIRNDVTDRKERERELQETRDRIAEHNRTLQRLYEISADPDASFEERVRQVLELRRERLGTMGAFLSRIDEDDETFELVYASGSDEQLQEGAVAPYAETYCRKTATEDDVQAVTEASAEGWTGDPAYERWGYEQYVGGRVTVGGVLEGTLAFVDREAAEGPFTDDDRTFVELASQWVSYELERRERERELREYREFTDDILDAVDDVFYIVDETGPFQRWNRSLGEVTGYTDEEIAGMHPTEFVVDDHAGDVADSMAEAFETGHARAEAPIRTKDGETIHYEFVGTRLEDPDGQPVVAGIGRDVSERKAREQDLRETKRRLELILEGTNTGIWEWNLERDRVTWDETAERMIGLEPGEFGGTFEAFEELVHPDDLPGIDEAVERAVENDELYQSVFRMRHTDRSWVWVEARGRLVTDDDGATRLVGFNHDVTARKEKERQLRERERELRRTKDLLQQAQTVADIGAWEVDLRTDPPEQTWTDQVYHIHDLPTEEHVALEEGIEFYHPDDRERIRQALTRAIEDGVGYDLEARLVTAEDTEKWIHSICVPITDDGEVVELRGSIQDITAQKERELALASLHDATRGLLGTETNEEAAHLVVEAAHEVLDAGCVGMYLLDVDSNRLEPVATNDAFEELCGSVSPVAAGDENSLLWNCFVSGSPMIVDDTTEVRGGQVFGESVGGGLLVPVGDHGVFVFATGEPTVADETRRLVETLVATTEAAFDRIDTETALRERDAELEARNRRLQRQIAITDVIRRVDESLVGASSREEIETAVTERLVDTEDVTFAWIGAPDAADDCLEPRAWAGTGGEYLDAISLSVDGDDAEPAVEVVATREPAVTSNVVDHLKGGDWARSAASYDLHSVVAVPLVYEGYFYGVLAVYADEPDTFGDLERTVFAELGESIAHSINAVETQQALHSDAVVEVTLQGDDPEGPLGRLARETGGRVVYEGLATHSEDAARLFVTVSEAESATVASVLDGLVSVREYRVVDEDDGLYEIAIEGDTLPSRIVRHGGRPQSVTVTADGTEVVVDVPTSTDVREFLATLEAVHPGLELASRRTVERAARTRSELVSSLFETLTDRQLEVLRTAFFAGFFEWPRTSTGEDVAEMLGVSQPTVNRHLRLAQQHLLAALFDGATAGGE